MTEPTVDLTIKDIAYILGVTRGTVYNKQRDGEWPNGSGLDVIRAAIEADEQRIVEIRARLSEKVAERLTVGV